MPDDDVTAALERHRAENATYEVKKPRQLCPPAATAGEPLRDDVTHLLSYDVKRARGAPKHVSRSLMIADQLGQHALNTLKPERLLVPAANRLLAPAPAPPDPAQHTVDHYVCYKVKPTPKAGKLPKGLLLAATDQFTSPAKTFAVKKPLRLCVPANKNGEGVDNPAVHLLCYQVKPAKGQPKYVKRTGVLATSQFGALAFGAVAETELCLPSLKIP